MERKLNSYKLIDLIKLHPELYSKEVSGGSAVHLREKAWRNVSQEMNVDIKTIRSRWKSLRDTFQRCLKKAHQSENDSVTIAWPYFEKLLFLKDYVGVKSVSSLDSLKESFSEEVYQGDPISYEDFSPDRNSSDISALYPAIQKIDTKENWSQFDEDVLEETTLGFNKTNFDKKDENSVVSPKIGYKPTKRKLNNDDLSNEHILKDEINAVDEKIKECLDIFKEKLNKEKDSVDNFCNFIGSFIKQWPTKDQCETIKFLTEHVMEKHMSVVNNVRSEML